jgi:hypothetical protein
MSAKTRKKSPDAIARQAKRDEDADAARVRLATATTRARNAVRRTVRRLSGDSTHAMQLRTAIARSSIAGWMSDGDGGNSLPTLGNAAAIAEAYGISIDELAGLPASKHWAQRAAVTGLERELHAEVLRRLTTADGDTPAIKWELVHAVFPTASGLFSALLSAARHQVIDSFRVRHQRAWELIEEALRALPSDGSREGAAEHRAAIAEAQREARVARLDPEPNYDEHNQRDRVFPVDEGARAAFVGVRALFGAAAWVEDSGLLVARNTFDAPEAAPIALDEALRIRVDLIRAPARHRSRRAALALAGGQ